MEMIDVAKFHVTVRISPGRVAKFDGEGHEWFVAELDLYFFEVWGKYKVKIEMVDFAGNELDPSYEEKFYGRCGGVLRFLDELWDFVCAVASAIADAVMKALSFVLDWIISIIRAILKPVTDALESVFLTLAKNVETVVPHVVVELKGSNPDAETHGELAANLFMPVLVSVSGILFGSLFATILFAELAMKPFLPVFACLAAVLMFLIVSVLLDILVVPATPSLPSDSPFDNPGDALRSAVDNIPDEDWWGDRAPFAVVSFATALIKSIAAGTFSDLLIGSVIGSGVGYFALFVGGLFSKTTDDPWIPWVCAATGLVASVSGLTLATVSWFRASTNPIAWIIALNLALLGVLISMLNIDQAAKNI